MLFNEKFTNIFIQDKELIKKALLADMHLYAFIFKQDPYDMSSILKIDSSYSLNIRQIINIVFEHLTKPENILNIKEHIIQLDEDIFTDEIMKYLIRLHRSQMSNDFMTSLELLFMTQDLSLDFLLKYQSYIIIEDFNKNPFINLSDKIKINNYFKLID
jgi:hypothetical protein